MIRFLYTCLLRLHPPHFRRRFSDEMLWIFDQATQNRCVLLVDAIASLGRQWLLRPHPEPVVAEVVTQASDVPVFQTIEDFRPRKSALINGGIASLAIFTAMIFAIGHSRGSGPFLFVGARYPRSHGVSVDRASLDQQVQPTTEVRVEKRKEDPVHKFATFYFRAILILRALDSNDDLTISPAEIAIAPIVLKQLDVNRDGKLNPAECGHYLGKRSASELDPEFVRRTGVLFMRLNPVLAVLDADHDARINAEEIRHSDMRLRTLDDNADGHLTVNELAPDPTANQEVMRELEQ